MPFVCVSTRLPWALGKVAASVEKQFGPSAVHGKSDRAADLLCKYLLALVHSDFSDRAVANRTQPGGGGGASENTPGPPLGRPPCL